MKQIIVFNCFLLILGLFILTPATLAQDGMKKPDPVKSATLDMLLGKWTAEPYEMMGSKWSEEANHYMKYGLYMFVDITGKDDKGQTYNGTLIVKPNTDGSFTGWSFDDWGTVSTYTGTYKDNKITVSGKSDWGTEQRDIEINGNTMVHKCNWVMKGADGKDMNTNMTITYHK